MRSNLYFGDCIQIMQTLPSASIDMILCDLPYGTTQCRWDTPIDLSLLWKEYKRVAKTNAAVVLFAQTPFDKVLGASNLEYLRYEWVWEKTRPTGHLNARKMPMKAHENVLVFYKKPPTYNPQKTHGHTRKTATKTKDCSHVYGTQVFDTLHYDSTTRYPRSVLCFASDTQKTALHPTQKPVALCKYFIETYSNVESVVLDNCMGSGTSGVACVQTNRRFIGIEKDETYFNIAKKRIADAEAEEKNS